jgi:CheY-like chemotaxis protein
MHGGTVEAHSDGAGRGSEFVVRLPVLTEAPQPPPRRSTRKVAAREGRRILVVDDNQDGARSLALMLELGGHQTQTVHDGLEAIAAAEEFRPDAVLLDIGLPKLDGYEVCRRIRGQPWGRDLVMVAVSGWGQEEDRHRSKEAGFDAHVVKPVDHEVLGKLLASFPSRGSDD